MVALGEMMLLPIISLAMKRLGPQISRLYVGLFLCIFTTGCASTQLNFNTLDIAESIAPVYTRQALANLSKIIDEPMAIPSQLDIPNGTIQTSNSVTPSITSPLSHATTENAAHVPTQFVTAGAGATLNASDAWQQNWNVSPVIDANALRNLRALYRFVVYGSNLREEYHVSRVFKGGKLVPDPYFLKEPQCVLCGPSQAINERLRSQWLYWTGVGALGERPPPSDVSVVDLGHYGNHELFMLRQDFLSGYLSDFTLFILPNAEPGAAAGAATPAAGRPAPSPNRPNFAPPPPPGIQPQGSG